MLGGDSLATLADAMASEGAGATAAAKRAAMRPLQRAEAQAQALRAEAAMVRAKAEASLDVERQRMAAAQEAAVAREATGEPAATCASAEEPRIVLEGPEDLQPDDGYSSGYTSAPSISSKPDERAQSATVSEEEMRPVVEEVEDGARGHVDTATAAGEQEGLDEEGLDEPASVAPKPPVTGAELALQQAQAEGLTLRKSSGKSGYAFVSVLSKGTKPYQAQVMHSGKNVYLGSFATAEEAALSVARSPEGQASAERAATAPPPTSSGQGKGKGKGKALPDKPAAKEESAVPPMPSAADNAVRAGGDGGGGEGSGGEGGGGDGGGDGGGGEGGSGEQEGLDVGILLLEQEEAEPPEAEPRRSQRAGKSAPEQAPPAPAPDHAAASSSTSSEKRKRDEGGERDGEVGLLRVGPPPPPRSQDQVAAEELVTEVDGVQLHLSKQSSSGVGRDGLPHATRPTPPHTHTCTSLHPTHPVPLAREYTAGHNLSPARTPSLHAIGTRCAPDWLRRLQRRGRPRRWPLQGAGTQRRLERERTQHARQRALHTCPRTLTTPPLGCRLATHTSYCHLLHRHLLAPHHRKHRAG